MSDFLAIVIEDTLILNYDRNTEITEDQIEYLDKMDRKMEAEGLLFGSELIQQPDLSQKAQFVANTLINALHRENEALTAASCAYLAKRLPDLKQVKARKQNERYTIELTFDRSYEQAASEQPIQFIKPGQASSH